MSMCFKVEGRKYDKIFATRMKNVPQNEMLVKRVIRIEDNHENN